MSIHSPGIESATAAGRPAPRGSAGQQPRWRRSSMPRVISADDPSGSHVAELDADMAVGLIDRTRIETRGVPTSSSPSVDRPVVGERAGVVGALVERLPPRQPAAARVPCGDTDVGHRSTASRRRPRPTPNEAWRSAGGRPRVEVDPTAGMEREIGLGVHRAADVDLTGRAGDAVAVAEVLVEERQHVDVVVDVRAGPGALGRLVHPRSGEQPPRQPVALVLLDHTERVVAIPVGPADDQHRRARHPLVAGPVGPEADRSASPRGAVGRGARATRAATAAWRRSGAAIRRASPRRTPRARAAARSWRSCRAGSRSGRSPAARRRSSARRRCSGRRWRRWPRPHATPARRRPPSATS